MVRAPCFDKHGIKKGAWSEDEDNKLRDYIESYGHLNWRELPKLAGLSRCRKSCRLRWMNYLRPNMKHGNFTKEEENVIISLHNKFGNKWSTIAARLPGRSDNEIKNHWNSHLKNRARKYKTVVLKSEQVESIEQVDAKPKECVEKNPNLKSQQKEVEVLLAVLSSEGPSSSSTSDERSSCSLSVSDYAFPSDVAQQVSDTVGNFWSDPFFPDYMFSPLGFADDFISQQASMQDYIMDDDVLLWSTLDLYL